MDATNAVTAYMMKQPDNISKAEWTARLVTAVRHLCHQDGMKWKEIEKAARDRYAAEKGKLR